MEAINGIERLGIEYGNQELGQEHLLVSLLHVEDSLILKLIEKMEINTEHFCAKAALKAHSASAARNIQIHFFILISPFLML